MKKSALILLPLLVLVIGVWFWNSRATQGPIAWSNRAKAVEIEVSGPMTADLEKFDNFLRAKIDTFFRVMYVPYPGFISKKMECDSKHKALATNVETAKLKFVGYRVFGGHRRQLGACVPEDIAFRVYLGRLHCVEKNVYYDLKYYEPISAPEDSFKTLLTNSNCN